MRKSSAHLALFALFLFGAACTPLRPKITKWHNELKVDPAIPQSFNEIDFGVHGFDLEPKSRGFNALQLSERGQKALINAVGALSDGSMKSLLAGLGTTIKPPAQPPGDIDATIIDRRLVISITHLPLHPADRLHMLKVRLYPIQDGVEFTNWSQIATRYQTIDLGSLSFDQTEVINMEASLAPSVLSELTGVKASRGSTKTLKESTVLKSEIASLSGRLASRELFLFEKGAPRLDLTGAISIDTTIKLPFSKTPPATITDFSGLFDKKGDPAAVDDVGISESLMDFPPWGEPVLACAELVAYTRRLCGGGSTITESDDCATLVPMRRVERVTLSPPVKRPLFLLRKKGDETLPLIVARHGRLLLLRDYSAAEDLRRYLWLRSRAGLQTPFNLSYSKDVKPSNDYLEIKAYAPYLEAASGQIAEDDCVGRINKYRKEYISLRNPVNSEPSQKDNTKPQTKNLRLLNDYDLIEDTESTNSNSVDQGTPANQKRKKAQTKWEKQPQKQSESKGTPE